MTARNIYQKILIQLQYIMTGLLVAGVFPIQATGKTDHFPPAENQYHSFRNVLLPLESSQINTIFQDREGLIWLGTPKGVFYYDGYNAKRLSTQEEIFRHNTTAILQPDNDHLIIGTTQGVFLLNLESEHCSVLCPELATTLITTMTIYHSHLWIGTANGDLYRYDLANHTLQTIAPETKEERHLIHVFEPANDRLYIGSYQGLIAYDSDTESLMHIPFPPSSPQSMVTSLLWDNEGNCLWIGTETGFYRYNKADECIKTFPLPVTPPIESIRMDRQGQLVLGTINGLYIYDKKSGQLQHFMHKSRNNQSLCDDLVLCSLTDRNGNSWVGTSNGLSLAQHNPIYQLTHVSELTGNDTGNQFISLCRDSRGNFWLGGRNGLILCTAQGDTRWYHTDNRDYPLRHNKVWRVYEDNQQNIWLATDGGVARYKQENGQFVFYTITDQSGQKNARWAYDLSEDQRGRLWIATYPGGLFVIDKAQLLTHNPAMPYTAQQNYTENNGASDYVYQLLDDKQGNLWAKTGYGLAQINLDNDSIRWTGIEPEAMAYDGNNYLWYSSHNDRLCRLNLSTWQEETVYTLPEEGGQIYSLIIAENLVCLSSTEGITCIDRNTLEVQHFNLRQNSYRAGCYDAVCNSVVWGGNDMIASFPLHALNQGHREAPVPVHIMAVYVGNRRLSPEKDYKGTSVHRQPHITLPYTNQETGIEVADLTYPAEFRNIYYRLSKQENWNKLPANQNRITFASLPPGTHTLEVRNGISPHPDHSAITRFSIRILPPWYASSIALTVYALTIATLLFLAIRHLKQRQQRKYEKVERSLDLQNMRMDFFMHISRELKTQLNLIVAPVANLMEEVKKEEQRQQLELVHKNALRLNTLVRKMLHIKQPDYEEEERFEPQRTELRAMFRSLLECYTTTFQEKKIEPVLECCPSHIWIEADTLKLELALLGLLTDIVHHADNRGSRLSFSLSQQPEAVTLLLSYQAKRKPASLKSRHLHGLPLAEKYIAIHHGTIEVKHSQEGTCIRIVLPTTESIGGILPTEAPLQASPANEDKPLLLLACDHPEETTFLTNTLSNEYNCLTASTANEAMEAARIHLPELIVTDLRATGKESSMELCRNLRRYQPTATISVVVLAQETGTDTEAESIQAGADAFLHKPIDISNLRLRLTQLLQARRTLEKKIRVEHITRPAEVEIPAANTDEAFLQHITALIEEQMENTEFNVSMLADLAKTDKKSLYRRMKQLTGIPPVEYIRQIRLKKAAMLLMRKDLSVSEVMYRVGFSNASYFSRCFVAQFGVTPTQYMAENL